MLGILARTDGPVALRANRLVRVADHVTVELTAADGSTTLLDLDSKTLLPLRVRYQSRERFPRVLSKQEREAGLVPPPGQLEEVEAVVELNRRQSFNGIFIPLAIRRTAKGVVFEEIRFEAATVNPRLSKEEFAALKK
jgi:hypothetical protein